MKFLELFIMLSCGALNAWGGYSWHNARRFIMPIVLGYGISIVTNAWWLGLLILPVMGTLCLGYFSDKNWGRALWIFLQAFVIGIGLLMTEHLIWYYFLAYVVIAGVVGGLYKNLKQIYGDFFIGTYLGCIILLVR